MNRSFLILIVGVTALGQALPVLAASDYDASVHFSQDANTMIREVNAARAAIRAGNLSQAQTDLRDAKAAHDRVAALSTSQHRSMIVPVYGELVQDSVLDKTAGTRHAGYTVNGSGAQFTSVAVDLKKSGSRIDAAQTALKDNNKQAASDTLAAIGSDFVVSSVDTDLPLLSARENLVIAKNALAAHHDKQAQDAVVAASNALARYAKTVGRHAGDAKSLSDQLAQTASNLGADRTHSENALTAWWSRVESWFSTHV
jgi:hypothetical protein